MSSERFLRQQAVYIVSRMPTNEADARRVLELVEELLDFVSPAEPEPAPSTPILTLVPKD